MVCSTKAQGHPASLFNLSGKKERIETMGFPTQDLSLSLAGKKRLSPSYGRSGAWWNTPSEFSKIKDKIVSPFSDSYKRLHFRVNLLLPLVERTTMRISTRLYDLIKLLKRMQYRPAKSQVPLSYDCSSFLYQLEGWVKQQGIYWQVSTTTLENPNITVRPQLVNNHIWFLDALLWEHTATPTNNGILNEQ